MMHAPLAPSSADRTVVCAGSVALCALHPEEETQDTREGDAAHWALAQLLTGQDIDVGLVAANGVTLDAEMCKAAEATASVILSRHPATGVGRSELVVANAAVHPLNWGTPDWRDYVPRHLFVDDFKYGHGYIEVVGNYQLINYAILTLWEMRGPDWMHADLRVTMTIHQPRNYHRDGPHRSWTVHVSELVPYFERLRDQYELAMTPNAPCVPSEHCGNCSGRHDCEANVAAGNGAAVVAYKSIPLGISPDAAGRELKRLRFAKEMLDARVSGLEQQIESTIKRGARVVGWVKDQGSGKTVWTKSKEEIIMLGSILGLRFGKDETITPLQAIELCKAAKIDPAVIAEYSTTLAGSAKLIQSENSTAAKAFSK